MFMKMDPKSNKKRDGRHCDLCGCSFPAVRCDKCNSQIFCLSCDDMYHRHPKRRYHLRKAVDPTPTPLARPVLPMKVSNLPVAPGDPSKMPLPPPRKKKSSKSIFNTFRKGSPASDTSPTLPKKEYSWSDRFGSIKKFMSQRPLPPVPNDEPEDFATDVARTPKNGFSFIHSKGEEKPPALPQRNQIKSSEHFPFQNYANNNVQDTSAPHENGFSHSESSRKITLGSGNQWPNEAQHNNWKQSTQQSLPYSENEQNFGTIRRQSQPLSSSSSAHEKAESGMHSSSSVTDLQMLSSMAFNPGMPAYPQYPFNPHMASQYQGPFPMYPQYPVYPQYFGNSWANLSSPLQTTDGDFSDQSENSAVRFQHMRNPVYKDKKAKRSQSVVVDRMSYQGQFYPYGPFLSGGYPPPPWISGHHVKEAPPSPATSLRSHSRLSQSQRRRKVTDDDDDLSSSPLSRPKSSSSEVSKLPQEVRKPICCTSSSDEEVEKDKRRSRASPAVERRQLKQEMLKRRASSPKQPSASRESPLLGRRYSADNKKIPKAHAVKIEDKESLENAGCEFSKAKFKSEEEEKKFNVPLENTEYVHIKEDSSPLERWHCKHCTFLNEPGERICRVCCKTAPKMNKLLDGTLQSVENTDNSQESFNKKQDMNLLSSALDEAEKEITRSLDELLKIKEESSEQEEHSQDVKFNQSDVKFADHVSPMKPLDIPVSHEITHTNARMTPENISGAINKNAASCISYIENDKQQINQEAVSITKSEISQPNDISTSSSSCIHANKTEAVPLTSANIIYSESQTRKDSFCQTYQDIVLPEFSTEKKNTDSNVLNKNCVHPLDRIPNTQSPLPHDTYHLGRGVNGIFGLHRAHSRASLFGGRLSDASPITHEYGGMDLIPSSLYRSLSRTSLLGDAEGWTSEYHSRHKPDFYLSMEELVERRRQESMRAQGLELVRMIREAEQQGFTADDIQVALNNCGKQNPVNWLQENWKNMIHTVLTLATNYGRDKKENDVGGISQSEARDALRLHKGNIWAAVTECVEGRQRKLLELSARGNFTFCEIVDALTLSEGDVEMAYSELTKTSLKPFLMRVWGSGEGVQNLDAARPELFDYKEKNVEYTDGIKFSDTVSSDKSASIEDIWEEEDYDEGEWEENFRDDDLENKAEIVEAEKTSISTVKYDLETGGSDELDKSSTFASLLTPESEKSEYCDATGGSSLVERCLSSTSIDEIYLVAVDDDDDIFEQSSSLLLESNAKGTGFLKKLANLKKGGMVPSKDSNTNKNNTADEDFDKSFEEKLNIAQHSDLIKTKSTNIEDFKLQDNSEVPSPTLNDEANQNVNTKKAGPPLSEKRIIVVHDKIVNESSPFDYVEKTSRHISSESAISDSVSSEDKINTSLIPEINFEEKEQFSKKLSKLTITSSLTSVKKLNNGKKNIDNEIAIENDLHSENVDTVHNEAGVYCTSAKEISNFQDSNEIDECINGTEVALSNPSECSNFHSVECKKLNSFNEAVKSDSAEENEMFKNKLDEHTNIEQDNKSIADVKNVGVSSKNDLRVTEFCHNNQGIENAEEYIRENIVFSKINDESVTEKRYPKSDKNDDETKTTLLHAVSMKNNAIEKLEKHDEDKIPTLSIDVTTGDPVFLTRDRGNPEITVEIKTSVADKYFSGSNESFSAMNSTVEENDTKMPTTDQNQESPIIITNNETGDKFNLIINETLIHNQKDDVKLDTVNTLKNAISVEKLIKPDNHAISENAMNVITAHEVETRMLETNEGHINILNLPPDYDTYEINDYVKPPVKTDISASNHLEFHDQVCAPYSSCINDNINHCISPKSNDSKFFKEDLKSLTTSNACQESTEFGSLGNSSHYKDNTAVTANNDTMQNNKVNTKIFFRKPNTNKSHTEVYAEELQVEEDQKGAFENNDLKNFIQNEEILVTKEVAETLTNVTNLNSQSLDQSGIINSDTRTPLVKELPDSSNINNSNSVIKQQDISNTSIVMNENSAFIPEEADEENTLESLKEKGENISKVKSRNNLGVSKVKGKRSFEIAKMEKSNTPESLKIERKNTPEISKMEIGNTPRISKMEGDGTLEIIRTEENNILEVKGMCLSEVSKDKKESAQTGLGTEEKYVSEAKETSTLEISAVKKQNISEVKGAIALEVEKEIASEVEKEIASEMKETITPEGKELQILEAKQIIVSEVEEKNISEVSKVILKHSSEVSNMEEASSSKIKVLDNVLKSGISRNIPKLSNESQFNENTDEAGEFIVSTSTDLLTSNKNEESVNDHIDNSVSDTNNELSTQPNRDKNNKFHLATTYTSTVVENSNLTSVVPFLKNVLDDSSVQVATVDSTITMPVNKPSIQTSSLIEKNIDTVENEELPTTVDNPSKNEAVSDDDISTNRGLGNRPMSPVRPVSHLRRMSFNTRKEAIIQERNKDLTLTKIGESKPWFLQKKIETFKPALPKRSIKQQLEFERRVRKLVADKKCRTYRKAEIIVQLLDMNFDEFESIDAANECSTLEQAISFLQQECQLCAGNYPIRDIISMVHCSHMACRECIKAYFTIQIRDRTIMELLCPFCNEPDITDEDVAQDYFNHLDIMLKKLVEEDIHELFQRKLRDRVLMKDPNFMWCTQCSSGFIADPYLKRLICPDCKAIMCASCRRLWEKNHENMSCEAFAAFKDSMDPQITGLDKVLIENGIDCPSCHFKYALAKGGCMHFKCIQCQHDFCSGCSKPFKMGQKCGLSDFCAKLGLHAHHPRNCLFYLRDKEPDDLQKLLDMNGIKYDKDQPENVNKKLVCQVMEQKETAHGMLDDICGKEVQDGYAGLCRLHYVEYLGQLVNRHKIDPIQIFDNDDLELVLKRASIRMPPRKYREAPDEYRIKLVQVIEEKLPLIEVDRS